MVNIMKHIFNDLFRVIICLFCKIVNAVKDRQKLHIPSTGKGKRCIALNTGGQQ